MYSNLSQQQVDNIVNNPLEAAKFKNKERYGFMSELIEEDENESPIKEPGKIVFDGGDEGDIEWEEFKVKKTLEDSDDEADEVKQERELSERQRRLQQMHRLRMEFWTSDEPPAHGAAKPDNTFQYYLDKLNAKGERVKHYNDKIICEICGSVHRRNQVTPHCKTKKHRQAAADLEMRIGARITDKYRDFVVPRKHLIEEKLKRYVDKKIDELLVQLGGLSNTPGLSLQ